MTTSCNKLEGRSATVAAIGQPVYNYKLVMKTSKKRQPSASELVNTFEKTLKNEQPSASELVNTFERTLKNEQQTVTNSNEKPLVERLSPAGAFWRSRPAVTKPALHGFRLPGCILRCKVLL